MQPVARGLGVEGVDRAGVIGCRPLPLCRRVWLAKFFAAGWGPGEGRASAHGKGIILVEVLGGGWGVRDFGGAI